MWLDVRHSGSHGEYDVAVGAVVVSIDNHRIHLIDDDKQVSYHCLMEVMTSSTSPGIAQTTVEGLADN